MLKCETSFLQRLLSLHLDKWPVIVPATQQAPLLNVVTHFPVLYLIASMSFVVVSGILFYFHVLYVWPLYPIMKWFLKDIQTQTTQ